MSDKTIPHFNYIITIHNKQDLIENVVLSVIKCMGPCSKLYAALDGCTDNSEKIIDQLIINYPNYKIYKIFTEDVHELKTINAGLRAANQDGTGFNIILQDDVILQDIHLERNITTLYERDEKMGIVSLRHGGNLSKRLLFKKKFYYPIKDYTENEKGHNPNLISMLPLGSFTYREIVIKSPVCIPFTVIRSVGLPDERFAPWDDISYCYSVSEAGFNNGVFAIDFISEKEWGTSRSKTQKVSISTVHIKNIALFIELFGSTIKNRKMRPIYSKKIFQIFDPPIKQKIGVAKFARGLRDHLLDIGRYNYTILLKK